MYTKQESVAFANKTVEKSKKDTFHDILKEKSNSVVHHKLNCVPMQIGTLVLGVRSSGKTYGWKDLHAVCTI